MYKICNVFHVYFSKISLLQYNFKSLKSEKRDTFLTFSNSHSQTKVERNKTNLGMQFQWYIRFVQECNSLKVNRFQIDNKSNKESNDYVNIYSVIYEHSKDNK